MASAVITRRSLFAAGAGLIVVPSGPRGRIARRWNMQLGWLGGGNQLGEVAAIQLGYFAAGGPGLKIVPGGPNNDGIAVRRLRPLARSARFRPARR
jgi:NitT/TauT family transport system substrate-binding protein